jgi:hypothetical protein
MAAHIFVARITGSVILRTRLDNTGTHSVGQEISCWSSGVKGKTKMVEYLPINEAAADVVWLIKRMEDGEDAKRWARWLVGEHPVTTHDGRIYLTCIVKDLTSRAKLCEEYGSAADRMAFMYLRLLRAVEEVLKEHVQ